jgi:hypothetical protein
MCVSLFLLVLLFHASYLTRPDGEESNQPRHLVSYWMDPMSSFLGQLSQAPAPKKQQPAAKDESWGPLTYHGNIKSWDRI